jgi:hypothetical protein
MNNSYARYISVFFALIISMGLCKGQAAFTGSEVRSEKVVKQSDAIFTGQIEEIGAAVVKAFGEKSYYGVKVKVLEVLKGTVDPEVSVSSIARTDTKVPEVAPETGKTYIFFAEKKEVGSQYRVLKLLPADDASISQVKVLIAAAPSGK